MRTVKRLLVAGLLAAVLAMPVVPTVMTTGSGWGVGLESTASVALAAMKRGDLEKGGYTCTYVATGFYECKKDGSTTYWCDANGTCEPKWRSPEPQTPGTVHVPMGGKKSNEP